MGGRGSWSYTQRNEMMIGSGSYGLSKPSEKLNNAEFQVISGNRTSIEATLKANEKKIAQHTYETGLVIDNQGFVIAAYKGDVHGVNFGNEAGLVRGNIVTHNHPSGAAAFSVADIRQTGFWGGRGIRATTKGNGTVELSNAGSRQGDWTGFSEAYMRFLDSGTGGKRSVSEVQKWLKKNAGDYGLKYKKER